MVLSVAAVGATAAPVDGPSAGAAGVVADGPSVDAPGPQQSTAADPGSEERNLTRGSQQETRDGGGTDSNAQSDVEPADASGATVYVGADDNKLYALDADTGSKEWEFSASDLIRSSPTVIDGTVFVASFDGNLYAVDAETGNQEWVYSTGSTVFSSPTIVGGTVYVGANDGNLYAVDAATGTEQWTFTEPSAGVASSPAVADGTVYVGSQDGTLYAVDAATGSQAWEFATEGPITSSPTVSSGTVYVGSHDSVLYAVDAATGAQEWTFTAPSDRIYISSPTVTGGTVYVGSDDTTLYAVDANSGAQEWAFTAPSEVVVSSPTVYQDTVYVGSEDGTLYAVDANSGAQEWAFTAPNDIVVSSPTAYEGAVYVGSGAASSDGDSTLYAVDADTGSLEWAFTDPVIGIVSSPTAVATPSGNSVGSRVGLETLGHHDGGLVGGGLDVTVTQTTRPDFPEVTVFAEVRDANGNPVTGLGPGDFTIREDGRTESIKSVDLVGSGPGQEISTSLVIDRSGSMEGPRFQDAKDAAALFVDQLQSGDEAQVVAFDEVVDIRQRWTEDRGVLESVINNLAIQSATRGGTSLWQATIEGVQETAPRQGRSAVIVLTDGKNNEPPNDVQPAIDAAKQAGIPVYTIGLGPTSGINEPDLERLADETGGDYYHAPDGSDLSDIYDDISERLGQEYVITYETSNTATDGTTRQVELTALHGGSSGSDTGSYVAPCAPLPVADFTMSPSNPSAGQTVTFDASPSSPNGGSIVSYQWDFNNDGQVDATGQTVSRAFTNSGTYEVRLTVEKACGASDIVIKELTVGGSGATIDLSDETIAPGNTGVVDLTATADDVAGFRAEIQFDPNQVQVVGVQDGDLVNPTVDVDNTAGTLTITNARSQGVDDPLLAGIEFQAVGSGPTTPVQFVRSGTSLNSETTAIPIGTYDDGLITIQQCQPGDANRDNAVTTLDATLVLRYVAGLNVPSSFDPGCADYNGDGSVTTLDATLILRDVAGLPTSAGGPTVSTDQASAVEFTVGSVSGQSGETATVDITVPGSPELAGFQTRLSFDPTVVTVESVDGVGLANPTVNIDNASGSVSISAAQAETQLVSSIGTVTLTFDGSPGEETALALVPSATSANDETSTLQVTVVNGTATVDGNGNTDPVATYANSSGIVDTPGLQDAIDDWQTGEIDTPLLIQVIDAWQTGEPVQSGQ